MRYVEPPRWQYYPSNSRPRGDLRAFIDAVEKQATWLEQTWWPVIHPTEPRTSTKRITRQLQDDLPFTPGALAEGPHGFRQGWNLETREKYKKLPYLYGEGDESLGAVNPDAVYVDRDRLTLVEIEGGGALTNYRGMKDIVETMLLPSVDYLALMVPFDANDQPAYRYYNRLTQSLYAEQVVQTHLRGILIVGY